MNKESIVIPLEGKTELVTFLESPFLNNIESKLPAIYFDQSQTVYCSPLFFQQFIALPSRLAKIEFFKNNVLKIDPLELLNAENVEALKVVSKKLTTEQINKLAWEVWEVNNKTHATGINPSAFVMGFAAGYKRRDEDGK